LASRLEKLYFSAPIWFQNLMVTGYGLSIWDKRYRPPHDRFLAEIESNDLGNNVAIDELQWRLFSELLEHAFCSVPFYMQLKRETGQQPSDFKDFADLPKLPIIEKEMIRRDPLRFCSTPLIGRGSFVLHTSGTTGTALTIYADKDSRRRHYAFWTRLRRRFGVEPGMKRATMFGRIICSPDAGRPPFWRYDAVGRNLLFSSYHLAPGNLPAYADKLRDYQPSEIIGYASSVYLLAKYLVRNPGHGVAPKVVFTTADKLEDHYRPVVEEAFGCPVVDQYGCAEMATFVAQDTSDGLYRVHPEHGIIEILDRHGESVSPHDTGEAICTGFINRAMPLLRYRLGDRLTAAEHLGETDHRRQRFAAIEGRSDDVLYSPEGRPLGRFSPIWKVVDGIFETQVIQRSFDSLDINIVVDPEFREDPDREILLEKEIRKRTGSAMSIRFNYLDSIPKNANGKFKTVVSEVERP
jgi:phenylacetate-CoA ligase